MKVTIITSIAAAVVTLSALSAPSFSEDASKHWKFMVENKSNDTVVEFRTQEDGEWSENWIDQRIEPGDDIELDFETDEGDCDVRTQIRMVDGTYFDARVNYCKATTLEIQQGTLVGK